MEVKWKLKNESEMKIKIQPENSAKRQLYRELNQIKWKLKLFYKTTKNT